MAPELLKTDIPLKKRITTKCDVFSLGASLLEIASSMNLPQNGDLWLKLREGYDIVFSPTAKRSQQIERLIGKMMHPDPDQRPDMDEILLHPCISS
jgi:serine/threonine protein kinase